ncbi:hypothetical protein B0T14DRAFT_565807 [Immersiella caudata]|uniref:Uncharacterized protein n=1 Tax=Immersiella caudata TaxID=314043 RepID=A0AA39WPA7_9PEZI|nr:hypothetical protein B0T14DRAFT_565807 [Immersiella caudata]
MHASTIFTALLLASGAIAGSLVPRKGVPIELLGRDADLSAYRVCGTRLCVDLSSRSCNDSSDCTDPTYVLCCQMTNDYFPPKEIWKREPMSPKEEAPKEIEA